MKFTTPCFVRVENSEERKELINWCTSIGYYFIQEPYELGAGSVVVVKTETVGVLYERDVKNIPSFVDCGTNVELFKALAAMTQYNDKWQWFTDGSDWVLCPDKVVTKQVIPSYALYHKATVEEIVEHFKNK